MADAAGNTINTSLGLTVQITANTNFTINYGALAPSLIISTNSNANVTLSSFVQLDASASLPQGFVVLSFGAEVGFSLVISPPSAAIISAQLVTPALSVASIALITGSVSAGCLQFDASMKSYSQVFIQSYSLLSNTITVPIPQVIICF
jgi:hypothetical protein